MEDSGQVANNELGDDPPDLAETDDDEHDGPACNNVGDCNDSDEEDTQDAALDRPTDKNTFLKSTMEWFEAIFTDEQRALWQKAESLVGVKSNAERKKDALK